MKKIIPIVLLFAVIIGLFGFSVKYRNQKIAEQLSAPTSEHVSVSVKEESSGNTIGELIGEVEDGLYKLYFNGAVATVVYKDAMLECSGWSKSIEIAKPELYYNDFDKDGEKELIIRLVDSFGAEGSGEYAYVLYYIKPVTEDDGTIKLTYIVGQARNWKSVYLNAITLEVTQLKNTNKFLQFAMNDRDNTITYDEKTGITDNKYVSYALADCNEKKEYYTVSKCHYGLGIYNIGDDGKITLDVQVFVDYEETDESDYVGDIHCIMDIFKGQIIVRAKSISFVPLEARAVSDPRKSADAKWNYKVNNLSAATENSGTISVIDTQVDVGSSSGVSLYFGNLNGDTRNLDVIDISEGSVVLTAKKGYSFDAKQLDSGKFRVLSNAGIDISDKAVINGDTLTITLDRSYGRDELNNIKIEFGI